MNIQLKRLKNLRSESCVTIILNTHRTKPGYLQDPKLLKNLVKEAGDRLLADRAKRDAQVLIDRLAELEKKIDHSQNLESLILFVNEKIAEYIRLPIAVENRVVIDHSFATRDLLRALHKETHYYVLVLDQQRARLIEAFNDKVLAEAGAPFPMENEFFSTIKSEPSNASRQTNLILEFFNRVDKEVNALWKNNPAPVLICSVESNYHDYLKIADRRSSLLDTFLNKNRMNEKAHAIITEAWKIVGEYTIEKNRARKEELKNAVSTGKFVSDTNDIWRAIKQGRVATIFVEQGRFQPAVIENDLIRYVGDDLRDRKDVIDDIYDELIEANLRNGGDAVFLPKGELDTFNGFGAITRY